jgi:hypothetical protein
MRLIAKIWSTPVIIFSLIIFIGHVTSWITTGTPDPYAEANIPITEFLPPIFMFIAVLGLAISWHIRKRIQKLGSFITIAFCLATLPLLFLHWPITQDPRYIMPYAILLIILTPGMLFLIQSYRPKT